MIDGTKENQSGMFSSAKISNLLMHLMMTSPTSFLQINHHTRWHTGTGAGERDAVQYRQKRTEETPLDIGQVDPRLLAGSVAGM